MPKRQVCELPVMKSCCKTCPFRLNKKGHWQDVRLANEVIQRTLFKSQQVCHGTEGKNRKAHNRCAGAYAHNLEIYKRMGLDHLLK